MKIRHLIMLAIGLLVFPVSLWAKTAVLIHGFQGGGILWRTEGVTPVLQQNGWADGGNFIPSRKVTNPANPSGRPERIFYTLELPLTRARHGAGQTAGRLPGNAFTPCARNR
ncbi:MAG: hypothetical protein R3E93_10525 [Thiothrix sp.]